MPGIVFSANTEELSRLSVAVAELMGQYDWIAARAMTRGVQAARQEIQQKIFPMI